MLEADLHIRALIFDMGDIFFDASPWRKWLTGYLRGLEVEITYPQLVNRWEAALVDVYLARREYWDAFADFLSSVGLDEQNIDRTIHAAREKASSFKRRQPFDGVIETLGELRQMGVAMAVLSDTESREAVVRQRMAAMGIEEYFDAVVCSVDIGHVKPQPEAFAEAMIRLSARHVETAFVGHDADELQGAMDFGIKAIAYNFLPPVPADEHIWHFSELIRLVKPGKV